MMIRLSQPKNVLQKLPMTWKKLGQLVPNNIEGHLHIEIPMSKIGNMIKDMRIEHEDNKKKWENITFSTKTFKLCLDECKKNSDGIPDCLIDSWHDTREECQKYEDKSSVRMEHLQIQKLEHRFDVFENNLVHKKQEMEDEITKVCSVNINFFNFGYYHRISKSIQYHKSPQFKQENVSHGRK